MNLKVELPFKKSLDLKVWIHVSFLEQFQKHKDLFFSNILTSTLPFSSVELIR